MLEEMLEEMQNEKVRVNLRISREAYHQLMQWSGSARHMGETIEKLILTKRSEDKARLAVNANANLMAAKIFLDKLFEGEIESHVAYKFGVKTGLIDAPGEDPA